MTYVRVKGFKIFRDRHGKPRCYHRASGAAVDLEKHPIGSAGFIAECTKITALSDKGADAKPGTLGLLIKRYRAHPRLYGPCPTHTSGLSAFFQLPQANRRYAADALHLASCGENPRQGR